MNKEKKERKFDCWTCKYRGEVPGSAHICCNHPSLKAVMDNPMAQLVGIFASVGRVPPILAVSQKLNIKANPRGIQGGWFNFPFNFDPIWLENCAGYNERRQMRVVKRWKFLRTGYKSEKGGLKWKVGEWNKAEGELDLCRNGLHCSKEPYQAFSYVQGEILAEVECRGEHLAWEDKECWREMRVVKTYRWTKKDSVKLAVYAAELVLPIFEKEYPNDKRPREAIEAAKRYLETGSRKGLARVAKAAEAAAKAAWSARVARAAEAAWSAAWSADWAAKAANQAAEAAWSAAKAAWSARAAKAANQAAEAAWSAAKAAWSADWVARAARAAEAAIIKKITRYFNCQVKTLKVLKEATK